ncbi:hypothetical protein PVK06_003495 [Gossypium arboreum]|uniref:Bifunctional inhibitor/plant lipid transfer protein/seed storage helical domain-containing protein n=1 Tax=Gossypium arboreum TaxID=29729 RepID=A0ABR0R7L0_GOSAR|nr:hypothetical protein PVK06_003495 [Gossypium arboreum]
MAQKMLMMAVLVILGTMMATVTVASPACLQSLMSCAPYFNNTDVTLPDDCCNPLQQAVATELICLCSLFNLPSLLSSFDIPYVGAIRIASQCGVVDIISDCISAPSPAPTP